MNTTALFAIVSLLALAGVLANVATAAETKPAQTITRAGSQPSIVTTSHSTSRWSVRTNQRASSPSVRP